MVEEIKTGDRVRYRSNYGGTRIGTVVATSWVKHQIAVTRDDSSCPIVISVERVVEVFEGKVV